MLAPLIVATLFLAGVIWNLLSPQGTLAGAAAGSGIVSLLAWLAWFVRREDLAAVREISTLLDSAANPSESTGHACRDEVMATKVRSYRLTFSCLVCSMTFQTRYYPANSPNRWQGWLWSMFLTLLFGWWHLPWGPLHTLRTICHNLRGGKIQTVQQVIDEIAQKSSTDRQ